MRTQEILLHIMFFGMIFCGSGMTLNLLNMLTKKIDTNEGLWNMALFALTAISIAIPYFVLSGRIILKQ